MLGIGGLATALAAATWLFKQQFLGRTDALWAPLAKHAGSTVYQRIKSERP
jgi:hypothetical protein